MSPRHLLYAFSLVVVSLGQSIAPAAHAQASAAEPAMQLPPDQTAFQRANAIVDKQARSNALQAFQHDYPKSKRIDRARSILLDLLMDQQPRDEARIHQIAKTIVDRADKVSRPNQENSVSYSLAEAPPNGIDLKAAEGWARDSVKQNSFPAFTARMNAALQDKKPLTPAELASRQADIKSYWAESQAANLQTLADVYLHEGKLTDANTALAQAEQLQPTQGANFVTRAQIEHAEHQDDRALDALESAEVYGGMTPAAQDLLVSLYSARHDGSRSGLDAEIDRRYRSLFKPLPAVAHAASSSGSAVLLALYTGSACEPCAAADLAVDAVLANYPRTEVVALAFDQHIPEPDPLANPATVARATFDSVHFTPTLRLDGYETEQIGGRRPETEKSYKALAAVIDKQLSVPTGTRLHLTAALTPAHTVAATASFQVTDPKALHKLLTEAPEITKAASGTQDAAKPAASKPSTPAKEPKLALNFALVQREVRFSGQNGIRFHAMVVRDLAKSKAADEFPIALTGGSSASFTFDPAAISAANSKYLADFAIHNERFGSPHFLTTDTTLPLDDLAIAAWVEDLSSHQVVAAAYAPVGGSSPTEQATR